MTTVRAQRAEPVEPRPALGEAAAPLIPAGYKLTEMGVIPKDWGCGEIGDLDPFVTSGSRGWARHYSNQGAAFLRITNLSRNSIYIDLSDLKLVKLPPNDTEGLRTQLQDGDLLVSITADIGIIGFIDASIPKPAYINQHIALIRFEADKVDSKFLSYFLASERPQRTFTATTDQGAKAGMNLSGVRKTKAVFPSLPEQRAIAAALSDVDALLDGLDRLIAKKRGIKQATMQQLLTGKQRLPGFSQTWETKCLGDIATIIMGQSPSSSNYNRKGDGLPLIQGNADISNRKTIKRIFTTEITKTGKRGDIVMSVRAPVGEISRAMFDVCLGRGVCAIRYNNDFMYHQLIRYELSWTKISKGSTFDSVNSSDVKALEIHLPCDDTEQTAITTILSDMDTEIATLETQRDKTAALKQGMMQELLTGRIRLI